MQKVCAVVVTYNRRDKLEKCIDSILNQKDVGSDVFVINNNSTDDTEEFVMSKYKENCAVRYFNTGANLGGAGGFEYGVNQAVKAGYEYIWIMDDDTWPSDTALKELFECDKELNGNWGFLSSVAYWTDGSVCKANIQKKSVFRFVKNNDYTSEHCRVQFASFVSLLVKSSVVCELGLPIGEYFIWTDDYEFTGRISKKYKGYMVPASKVTHAMAVHQKANIAKDDISRIERYSNLFRNDVHCYKQHGVKGFFYVLLKDIYMALSVIIKSNNKINRLNVIREGVNKGLRFNPEIKYLAEDVQSENN